MPQFFHGTLSVESKDGNLIVTNVLSGCSIKISEGGLENIEVIRGRKNVPIFMNVVHSYRGPGNKIVFSISDEDIDEWRKEHLSELQMEQIIHSKNTTV